MSVGRAHRNARRRNAQLAREKERLTYERTFALHALHYQRPPLPFDAQYSDHVSHYSSPNHIDHPGPMAPAAFAPVAFAPAAASAPAARAARAPAGDEAVGVEMLPIDETCDTAGCAGPWRPIFPSRVKASRVEGGFLDSAALLTAAGGAVPPFTQSLPAVDTIAGPPVPSCAEAAPSRAAASPSRAAAISTMDRLDHIIAQPGNRHGSRHGSSGGGSSYGTESECSRYAAAVAMASTAQSLPQSPPQSPPQTPLQTPQSLARAEALERTLRLCGLVPEPSAAEEASLPEALEPPASPNRDDGAASPWPPHGSLPRDVAGRPPHGLPRGLAERARLTGLAGHS